MAIDNNSVHPTAKEENPKAVALKYEAANRVNFASAQNDVAIIERLVIDNSTLDPLTDVRITFARRHPSSARRSDRRPYRKRVRVRA